MAHFEKTVDMRVFFEKIPAKLVDVDESRSTLLDKWQEKTRYF
jgi:hypothetical protein